MNTCRTIEHCFHRKTRDIQAFGWVFIEHFTEQNVSFSFVFFRFVSFGYFDMPVAPILKPTGTIDTPCYKAVPKDFEANLE